MDLLEVSKEELIEVLIEKGKKIDKLRKRCGNLKKNSGNTRTRTHLHQNEWTKLSGN